MNSIKKKFVKIPDLSVFESLREIGRNPFVDWMIILLISATVAVLMTLGGINLYIRVASGDIRSSDAANSSSVKIFNKKDLTETISQFDMKKTLELQVKRGYSGPSDPAI